MLDVRRLRILREVASRGTIAAAADALSYTPSAVSQQLAALEREVGVPLLERRGRRVALTDAARTLVAHTHTILADLELAEADVAAMSELPAGTLRMAAFPTAAGSFVAPAIVAVERLHPALTVSLREMETDDSIPALKLGDVDVVVAYEFPPYPEPDRSLDRVDLFMDRMDVALPPGHPCAAYDAVPLATLADERWVIDGPGTLCRQLLEQACAAAGFAPKVAFESNDFGVFASFVSSGLGVALLPALAGGRLGPHVTVRPLEEEVARRLFIAVRRGSGGKPAIAATVAALREAAERRASAGERRRMRVPAA